MTNNPTNRQEWIFDLLKVEQLGFSECFSKYFEKFSKSEVTFSKDWNAVSKRIEEYRNNVNKAKEDASISVEVSALKSGLKSKFDRLLEKQKDIERLRESVEIGWTDDFYIANGEHILFRRQLTEMEKATLLKRASEIETEISKIEADYAPIKKENRNVDENGNDITDPLTKLIMSGKVELVSSSDKDKK